MDEARLEDAFVRICICSWVTDGAIGELNVVDGGENGVEDEGGNGGEDEQDGMVVVRS